MYKYYRITGLDRPLVLQEVEATGISRQPVHEDGEVVSSMHWLPLPHRRYLWYSFLLESESTPKL
jgi:hypothetical protein